MKNLTRELLLYEFQLGHTTAEAIQNIVKAKGEDAIKKSAAYEWFKKFRNGDFNLEDEPRIGRPCSFDSEELRTVVESNPSNSIRKLSAEVGASKETVRRHLHKLGMVNKSCRSVPHELTEEQANRRLTICSHLLQNPQDIRFLKSIVTCDEKWVYYNNPDMTKQWVQKDQPAKQVPKRGRFNKKAMLCVWWNYEGIIYFEVIPDGVAINAGLYSQQIDKMYAVMLQRYPALTNRKRIIIQQDNARPHTAAEVKRKINSLDIEILPHPAYSPDLAPSDFHLFRSMSTFLKGRKFQDLNDIENACRDFFASKDTTWYQNGILQLSERWLKTIQHDGLYFDE